MILTGMRCIPFPRLADSSFLEQRRPYPSMMKEVPSSVNVSDDGISAGCFLNKTATGDGNHALAWRNGPAIADKKIGEHGYAYS